MYCKNCGAQIPDNSPVCNYCGKTQTDNFNQNVNHQNLNYGYNQNQNFNNPGQNYGFYQPNLQPMEKGSIIVALVLSVLTGSIVSIVLTILALVYANDYDTAIRCGDFATAEKKKSLIKTFKIISWVLIGLSILLSIISIIYLIVFGTGVFAFLLSGFSSEFDDFYYYGDLVCAAVQALKFGLLG